MDNVPEFDEDYGLSEEEWDALTLEDKRAYANVGEEANESGMEEDGN